MWKVLALEKHGQRKKLGTVKHRMKPQCMCNTWYPRIYLFRVRVYLMMEKCHWSLAKIAGKCLFLKNCVMVLPLTDPMHVDSILQRFINNVSGCSDASCIGNMNHHMQGIHLRILLLFQQFLHFLLYHFKMDHHIFKLNFDKFFYNTK